MKRQVSFSELENASKKEMTRRERLLADIEALTPWTLLISEIGQKTWRVAKQIHPFLGNFETKTRLSVLGRVHEN